MTDPNQELAEKTIERLVKEGLLSEKEGNKLSPGMASGTLNQDDWRVALENSAEKDKSS
jgi:hypothetical protein